MRPVERHPDVYWPPEDYFGRFLPPVSSEDRLKQELWQAGREYLDAIGYRLVDEVHDIVFARNVMRSGDPGSYRVDIALHDVEMFTPAFITHLQREVMQNPEWVGYTAWIWGDASPDHLLIEGNCILLSTGEVLDPMDGAIANWQDRIRQVREQKDGPSIRQFKWVKSKLLTIVSSPIDGLATVGLFDNYDGDLNRWSIWVLHPCAYCDMLPVALAEVAGGMHYAVDSSGRIGLLHRVYDDPPLGVAQWIFPFPLPDRLVFRRKTDGVEFTIEIASLELIRDADLKRSPEA